MFCGIICDSKCGRAFKNRIYHLIGGIMEKEVKYFKMFYTRDYDTKLEKSRRALLRAYQKAGILELIQDGYPFIMGYIEEDKMYELFTNSEFFNINGQFVGVSKSNIETILNNLGEEKKEKVRNIMRLMVSDEVLPIWYEITTLGFDITDIDELSRDNAIQWFAYQDEMTDVNPYDRETLGSYTRAAVKKYNRR